MILSHTVKLRPSKTQIQALSRGCAAARVAWNYGLGRKIETWKIREFALIIGTDPKKAPYVASAFDLCAEIVQLKRAPKEHADYRWMAQTASLPVSARVLAGTDRIDPCNLKPVTSLDNVDCLGITW